MGDAGNMINTEQISEYEAKTIAKSILNGLGTFFGNPENRERFEEWKKRRDEGK